MAPGKKDELSPGGTLPKMINEELLICKLCLSSYDIKLKTPRMLNCSHTFCENCITEYLINGKSKRKKIECPLCCEKTKCGDGVSSLPENEAIINLIGIIQKQIEKEAMKKNQEQSTPYRPKQISSEGNIWVSESQTQAKSQLHQEVNAQGNRKTKGILKSKKGNIEKCDCLIVKSANVALHPVPNFFNDEPINTNEIDFDPKTGEDGQPTDENQWIGSIVYPMRQLYSMAPNSCPESLKQKSKHATKIIPDTRPDPFKRQQSDEFPEYGSTQMKRNDVTYEVGQPQYDVNHYPTIPDYHQSQIENIHRMNINDHEDDLDFNYFNQTSSPSDQENQFRANIMVNSYQGQEKQTKPIIRTNVNRLYANQSESGSIEDISQSERRSSEAVAKYITQFGRFDDIASEKEATFHSPTKISCSNEGHLVVVDPIKINNNLQMFTADGNFLSSISVPGVNGICFLDEAQLGIANHTGIEIYTIDGQLKKSIPIGQLVSIAPFKNGFVAAHSKRLTVCPVLTSGFVMHSIHEVHSQGQQSIAFQNILDVGTCKTKENSIIILDSGAIKVINETGLLTMIIYPELHPSCGPLKNPFALALNPDGDWIIVTDSGNKRVLMFDINTGNYEGALMSLGISDDENSGISGVAINQFNQMYLVCRSINQADIKIFSILYE